MVGRVLLGQRSGSYGLWISRPGIDVLGAGEDQLLLSGTRASAQVVASGILYMSKNQTAAISWSPNLGFAPAIIVGSARFPQARADSVTGSSAVINSGLTDVYTDFMTLLTGSPPVPPSRVVYTVLNRPV